MKTIGGGRTYDARFTVFYDAIKAKYPQIQIIEAGRNVARTRTPDVSDDHFYMNVRSALTTANRYDNKQTIPPRQQDKRHLSANGQLATIRPTAAWNAALSDAVFLTAIERNSDIVIMSCYAPLFVNVNPGGQQWATDLIGYDTLTSFGGAAYYVQKLFYNNVGDVTVPYEIAGEGLWAACSKDNKSGELILKLVSRREEPTPLEITLQGVPAVNQTATGWLLTGGMDDVNTVAEPTKVAPKEIKVNVGAPKFTYELPPRSLTVIRVKMAQSQAAAQPAPARGDAAAPGARRGGGRGGFGGPIQLGPDDKPAFDDPPAGFNVRRDNIAHGELTTVQYDSKTLGTRRQMVIYTPVGYSTDRKYPVLFLLHGIGGNDREWQRACRADNVLDNLIADGKIQPMIVVFPNGNASVTADAGGGARGAGAGGRRAWRSWRRIRRLGNAFRERLDQRHHPLHRVPLFRIYRPRTSRLGGTIDGRRPVLEHRPCQPRHVCLGRWVLLGPKHQELRPSCVPDPAAAKEKLKLLWIACGNRDGLIRISQGVHNYLKEKDVPHVWHVDGNAHDGTEWANNLYLFAQKIFR